MFLGCILWGWLISASYTIMPCFVHGGNICHLVFSIIAANNLTKWPIAFEQFQNTNVSSSIGITEIFTSFITSWSVINNVNIVASGLLSYWIPTTSWNQNHLYAAAICMVLHWQTNCSPWHHQVFKRTGDQLNFQKNVMTCHPRLDLAAVFTDSLWLEGFKVLQISESNESC